MLLFFRKGWCFLVSFYLKLRGYVLYGKLYSYFLSVGFSCQSYNNKRMFFKAIDKPNWCSCSPLTSCFGDVQMKYMYNDMKYWAVLRTTQSLAFFRLNDMLWDMGKPITAVLSCSPPACKVYLMFAEVLFSR